MIKSFILFISFTFCLFVKAEESKSKIAVIDMDRIINKTKEYIVFNDEINSYIKKQNELISTIKEDSKKNNKKIDLNLLSPNGVKNMKSKNTKNDIKIQQIIANSQKYIEDEEIKVKNKIIRRLIPIIKEYVKNKKYLATIDITSIVYDNQIKFTDISDVISSIYNSKY